ncbi:MULTISPECIES: hypothetical protein [unclassified Afipia]|uniref:hypothetical protein n=1 Tax=unclassified Afipia TaxID=2642050 RepID=UPI0003FBC8B1|nr:MULTISPECIES: hypothetical protein [unclassified Afipia]
MSAREDALARHQRQRWLRPDANRWLRPDAARFLKPDTDPASVYPALEQKYSPSQPRVPAGNGRESGRWTDASSGGAGNGANPAASPMGHVDFGDLPNFSDVFSLFQITPGETDNTDYAQLAGNTSEDGGPELPSNEPPEVPAETPKKGGDWMRFVRSAADWIKLAGRYSPFADAFFGAVRQIDETNEIINTIKSANDPPRSLEELQDRVNLEDRSGYHRHHIVEEKAARTAGFSEDLVQGRENLVLVPFLKHLDITSHYARKVEQGDGSWLSPRDLLKDKDFETRREYGLKVLRDYGVLK